MGVGWLPGAGERLVRKDSRGVGEIRQFVELTDLLIPERPISAAFEVVVAALARSRKRPGKQGSSGRA